MKRIFLFLLVSQLLTSCYSQKNNNTGDSQASITRIKPGAERLAVYLPLLQHKTVAVFANQTSTVGNTHLVDTLQKLGIAVKAIFSPEHGFRGDADAGAKVGNYIDEKTGIPVISLYGSKRKPSAEDLKDIDIMIFDIQDVGTRFYTYISSLEEYMESAFENHKPLLLLDRPNPNGFYVDGPVLDKDHYRSFVGMQSIPIVYGMTLGEYAMMIAGEQWLSPEANKVYQYYQHAKNSADTPFHFLVIKCASYTHKSKYQLPVKPSPNLPSMQSVYCYPSTCFFEGTVLSEGRGTEHPFCIFGHPSLPSSLYAFTPVSRPGATDPKLKGQRCYGWYIDGSSEDVIDKLQGKIQLSWLLNAYRLFPDKDQFFIKPRSGKPEDYFFNKLAGNSRLMEQLKAGYTEAQIRAEWQGPLQAFKAIRKKYLLYEDFE